MVVKRPEFPQMTVPGGFPVTVPLLKPLSLGAGEPFPWSSRKPVGTWKCASHHPLIPYCAPLLAVCQRQTLVKLFLQPRVSQPLSVGAGCGSHAEERPEGRSVSKARRGGRLSAVTETWVLGHLLMHTSFTEPHSRPRRSVGWLQVALASDISLKILSQQLRGALSPSHVCLQDGISFSSVPLPLHAHLRIVFCHLSGREDRLVAVVLLVCAAILGSNPGLCV